MMEAFTHQNFWWLWPDRVCHDNRVPPTYAVSGFRSVVNTTLATNNAYNSPNAKQRHSNSPWRSLCSTCFTHRITFSMSPLSKLASKQTLPASSEPTLDNTESRLGRKSRSHRYFLERFDFGLWQTFEIYLSAVRDSGAA